MLIIIFETELLRRYKLVFRDEIELFKAARTMTLVDCQSALSDRLPSPPSF
jgi:hypothetical protein